ncbi:MAG: hypothetical protein CVV45_15580, partial [Spirochaetae bacterium HGW-Spirochaetae-10]
MKSDQQIRKEGFDILFKNMDNVEAERFIALINRERFDYTKWRQPLFEDMTPEEIIQKGQQYAKDLR